MSWSGILEALKPTWRDLWAPRSRSSDNSIRCRRKGRSRRIERPLSSRALCSPMWSSRLSLQSETSLRFANAESTVCSNCKYSRSKLIWTLSKLVKPRADDDRQGQEFGVGEEILNPGRPLDIPTVDEGEDACERIVPRKKRIWKLYARQNLPQFQNLKIRLLTYLNLVKFTDRRIFWLLKLWNARSNCNY